MIQNDIGSVVLHILKIVKTTKWKQDNIVRHWTEGMFIILCTLFEYKSFKKVVLVNNIITVYWKYNLSTLQYISINNKKENKSRSEPGNAPRIGIGHREVVCQM